MSNSSARVRAWIGPAILSYGYRPFFLLAGLWAAVAMVLWVMMLSGRMNISTAFTPVDWHAHEFLFGYLSAVLAGFLLTAVPNWTGRLPITGWRLAGLAAIWLAGRGAVAVSAHFPPLFTAFADMVFLIVFAAAIAREIIAGKNWRNLPVLALLGLFIAANGVFHWHAAQGDTAASGPGLRMGLAVAVLFISFIGGRVVPSFTRNWLVRQGSSARPAPIGRFDQLVLAASLIALIFWVVLPLHPFTTGLCLLAGVAGFVRLARWSGWHTGPEPLVWVLHVGYACVPLGFLAVGAARFLPDLAITAAAQHIWMVGAVGLMTLAVMTRASLGHAGRPLHATGAVTTLYLTLISAVIARFALAFFPGSDWLLYYAAAGWIATFSGFAVLYWPIFMHKPKSRK